MNRAISTWGMHAILRQEELLEEARRERLAVKARRPGPGRTRLHTDRHHDAVYSCVNHRDRRDSPL
jgi:hypothetical protein